MSARFGTTLRGPPAHAQDAGPDTAVGPIEAENQFLVRLPSEPAQALREALKAGAGNVRERLTIQLEPEKGSGNPQLRRGQVRFDGWSMSAKLVDLPTILESQKTVDKKTFYKTADICQMLVCKEGDATEEEDAAEESPGGKKAKKADPNKVDKKYIWKHGVCPPLKNCRRRRFRKTLKKKFIEAPEIEKEVKRLLRLDNEAVEVKYDLVTEEELAALRNSEGGKAGAAGAGGEAGGGGAGPSGEGMAESNQMTMDEQELFGDLTDSDDDEDANASGQAAGGGRNIDIDSEGDSTMFEGGGSKAASSSATGAATAGGAPGAPAGQPVVTQFNPGMFHPPAQSAPQDTTAPSQPPAVAPPAGPGGAVAQRLESLREETAQLKVKKQELERNIANCDNLALAQRFKQSLAEVEMEMAQKEEEAESLSMFS